MYKDTEEDEDKSQDTVIIHSLELYGDQKSLNKKRSQLKRTRMSLKKNKIN